MLEQLPEPSECRHTFSDEFEQKMRELMDRKNHHGAWHKFAHRAAAVILAVLLGLGAWLAVDQDARAAVTRWIREVYENSVFYRFSGEASIDQNHTYELAWIPEGYEKVNQASTDTTQSVLYESKDSAFTFLWHNTHEGSLYKFDGTKGEGIPVLINGLEGHYYPAANSNTTNDLVWIDDNSKTLFSISSYLPFEDILHIAESVKLVKTEN
jgi:hypothetical protein